MRERGDRSVGGAGVRGRDAVTKRYRYVSKSIRGCRQEAEHALSALVTEVQSGRRHVGSDTTIAVLISSGSISGETACGSRPSRPIKVRPGIGSSRAWARVCYDGSPSATSTAFTGPFAHPRPVAIDHQARDVCSGRRRGVGVLRWSAAGLSRQELLITKGLVERRDRTARECGVEVGPNAFVFRPVVDGSDPWRPYHWTSAWRRLRPKVGSDPSIWLRDIRHFAATRLLDAGIPVKTVSGRLGHARPGTPLNVSAH